MKLTLTGGSGFVGTNAFNHLSSCEVTSLGRRTVNASKVTNVLIQKPHLAEIGEIPKGQVFLHLGGYSSSSKNSDFNAVNIDWPRRMVEYAIKLGYQHFVFMSTAKVFGDYQHSAITKNTPTNPCDRYAESKLLAEQAISQFADEIGITVLRPPAIYGAPPAGGFKKLVQVCKDERLFPVCSGPNLRSFVSVENVISAIQTCMGETAVGYNEYLLHENEVISTNELLKVISSSVQTAPKRIYLSPFTLSLADSIFGLMIKRHPLAALHRNFYIECDEFSKKFDWAPLHSTSDGVKQVLNLLKH